MLSPVRPILRFALSLIMPHRCLRCGETVGAAPGLCAVCFSKVDFLGEEGCPCCGVSVPQPGLLCGACLKQPPVWSRARSAFSYTPASRDLILRFKHADATHMAPVLAAWLHRAGGALLPEADLLVPVPLHWRRLFFRRYNQSALLARHLSALCGVPADVTVLKRIRHTTPQGTLRRGQRQDNVRTAFRVTVPSRVAGKRIVLLDDVLTTGATVSACARALRAAGAADVAVLTLARVMRP
ncbi:ComF family protein [Novispirillum itersonii]|uniref:ComF family protein n=1 Tax=Novispirillum itersonii TaxID=189 RepID=A0A7X0DN79_NOVIT|nr:ComF family protein [Novispirillum itersonii]MBB6209957.1 ComF family protein [Novispirillum itersonii]